MPSYYDLDSSRATFREYLFETKNPLTLLIAAILKVFRVRIPGSTDDANCDSTLESCVAAFPPDVEARFSSIAAELTAAGFVDPVLHYFYDPGTQTRLYWATYRHVSGRVCARIHHRYWEKGQKKDRGTFPLFITEFTDGTFLVSSAGKPDVLEPQTIQMNRMHRASTGALFSEHQRLVESALAQKEIFPVNDRDGVAAFCERLHIQQRDFHLSRGFFRKRTAAEEAKAQEFAARVESARAAGVEYPEIIAELTRLQDEKPRWSSGLWILVFSVIGFIAAGALQWDWKFTLWLIPILFLHELGHWIAMRIFKYRNLRMFFIPFFGAAVTGQNWNVPGWKKALVSLAGPLPGIALGVIIGCVGMYTGHDVLKKSALMLIFINAFNLLPVLPLDGGHFLHATLFCRNRWLDIIFRCLAAVTLLVVAALGMGRFFMGIGIALAVGLPVAFKLGKVTDRFRSQPLMPPLPGEDRVPAPTAQALITAVKEVLPAASTNKMIAQQVLGIFETLNARPPGALATISLLILYSGSILVSVVFGALVFISKSGGVGDFLSAAARQPSYSVECDGCKVWRGSNSQQTESINTLVASFDDLNFAKRGFEEIKTQLPDDAIATMFGNSIVLSLPAINDKEREKWFSNLQSRTTNTFVTVSNNAVTLSLQFIAPNSLTATNLQKELNDYFGAPGMANLIPPWHPSAASPEFEQFRNARRVWSELNKEVNGVWQDAELKEYNRKIAAAHRRGAVNEAERLGKEQEARSERLKESKRQQYRAKYTSSPLSEVVAMEATLAAISYTNNVERKAVIQKLGKYMGAMDHTVPSSGFGLGRVTLHGLLLEAPYLSIHNPSENLPLLLDWFCKKGCKQAKYDIQTFYSFGDNFDAEE